MELTDCFGSPTERGQSHGESLRERIADALVVWEHATIAGLGARAPRNIDAYCDRFLNSTALIQRVQTETPDLYAELIGIAAGSGQPLPRIAAYNLMDEQWWYDAAPDAPPPGCSLIAAPVDGGHVLAQNMDLPLFMEGSQVALRLGGPDIPETIVLSAAGLIGLTGANAAGLAIGVNTLLMLHHATDGLPVAFAMRHALGASNRAEASARLRKVGHASGQHYALVTQDGISSFECSANSCATVPARKDGTLLHTNHPLVSKDIDAAALARLDRAGFTESSITRLDWLTSHPRAINSAADVQALFDDRDAPICMRAAAKGRSSTFASVLYEMTELPGIRMRQGVEDGASWHALTFSQKSITN
ncbi:C45 family peptidase [Pseudorhodobacter sp.]|uniref:C45 family autoproteolytic acyltransferase/hydolase n=1 Tax=Pseudorhodobacter sp. TaxID=1934400 RepID=UPI002648BB37|nr:C45 family peptidase [Pseudorhodobacter sp.]MDN5786137.1 C45 family peptidase [Pseudorhodobacter sp.]